MGVEHRIEEVYPPLLQCYNTAIGVKEIAYAWHFLTNVKQEVLLKVVVAAEKARLNNNPILELKFRNNKIKVYRKVQQNQAKRLKQLKTQVSELCTEIKEGIQYYFNPVNFVVVTTKLNIHVLNQIAPIFHVLGTK